MTTAGQSRLARWTAGGALMLAGAILALALIPNLVAAQTAEGDETPTATEERHDGERMGRHGFFRSFDDALSVTAELTGTASDEVTAALRDGASLTSYAAERGVDREELTSAIVAAMQQNLEERVAAGDITRERADELLVELDQKVEDLVDREGFGPDGAGCDDSDDGGQEYGEETANDTI